MDHLATSLRQFITENFLFGMEEEFSDDDSLLDRGIIDSTGVLELIAFLESAYGVVVEGDELLPENLDSVANLTRFIARKGLVERVDC